VLSGIVLAAGRARRFGSAKPLALYEGRPLVRHVVEVLDVRDVQELLVVVPTPEELYRAALVGTRARTVVNDQPDEGMSRSLRIALSALDPASDAIVVALADQPTIERDVIESLIREWRRSHQHIIAPVYRGERGHPVLFDATTWPELRAVTGDRGARDVIERDPRRVSLLPFDRDVPRDVDTPEDLAELWRPPAKGA
jgi:molybdenum cofactor cytidylyltransferase